MKTILFVLLVALAGCASEPEHNFYSYYGGYQVVRGDPAPKYHEYNGANIQVFDPFEFAAEHHSQFSQFK